MLAASFSQPPSASPTLSTEALFRSHGSFVRRFLTRLGVPWDRADDVLQDVFLAVHQGGGYRPGAARPSTYLAGIAIRTAWNDRRRRRVDAARRVDREADLLPSGAADPVRACSARQELEQLHLACNLLPEELRIALLRVDVAGESCLAVAAELQIPVGTVYSRLHAARKRLCVALQAVEATRARVSPR